MLKRTQIPSKNKQHPQMIDKVHMIIYHHLSTHHQPNLPINKPLNGDAWVWRGAAGSCENHDGCVWHWDIPGIPFKLLYVFGENVGKWWLFHDAPHVSYKYRQIIILTLSWPIEKGCIFRNHFLLIPMFFALCAGLNTVAIYTNLWEPVIAYEKKKLFDHWSRLLLDVQEGCRSIQIS